VPKQGCQILFGKRYQNGENIPNDHKTFQMAGKFTQWPKHIPTSSICKTFQNLPKLFFVWFENIPSGNPVPKSFFFMREVFQFRYGGTSWNRKIWSRGRSGRKSMEDNAARASTIEILVTEQVCLHWSCKYFGGKNTLKKIG
jgi:hypothetical protein